MNYRSTKQTAECWGITPRRISLLASQGRIEGAKLIDGRWFIPEDAPKPADPRKNKPAAAQQEDTYVFPFLLACVSSEAQIAAFSKDEKALYELCLVFEAGDFARARVLGEALLASDNQYIRLGALYHLVPICVYLSDYQTAEKYYVLFRAACQEAPAHKAEVQLLLMELDGEFLSGSAFLNDMDFSDLSPYSDALMPFIGSFELFAGLAAFTMKGIMPNVAVYETMCRMTEAQGYFYCAELMHLDLSTMYAAIQDTEKETLHFKAALDIGLRHGMFYTLSFLLLHNADTAQKVMRSYPPQVSRRIGALTQLQIRCRDGYAAYRGKGTNLARLKEKDYLLVSCCLKKQSVEQMAERFGLSAAGIKRRLSILYKKLGVKSKNELTKVYLNSIIDWETT